MNSLILHTSKHVVIVALITMGLASHAFATVRTVGNCPRVALGQVREIVRRTRVVRIPGTSPATERRLAVMDPGPNHTYLTVPMLERYRGEHLPDRRLFAHHPVYLGDGQRLRYRATLREGRITSMATNGTVDTAAADKSKTGQRCAIFVMDERGHIYLSTRHPEGQFHHTSLVAGGDVAAAGEMVIENGRLRSINLCSGHYKPPLWMFDQVVGQLMRMGVDLSGVQMNDVCN